MQACGLSDLGGPHGALLPVREGQHGGEDSADMQGVGAHGPRHGT